MLAKKKVENKGENLLKMMEDVETFLKKKPLENVGKVGKILKRYQ